MVASMPGRLGNAGGPGRHAREPSSVPLARGRRTRRIPRRRDGDWRAGGTPSPPPAATMSEVDAVGDWRGSWAGRGQRIAAAPLAPAMAGALLGVLAVAETLARAAGTRRPGPDTARPGAGRPGHHGAPGPALGPAGPRRPGGHRGGRGVARGIPHADRRGPGGPARRALPARPARLGGAGRRGGHALPGGGAGSSAAAARRRSSSSCWSRSPRWPPGPASPGGRAARPSRTAPPGRSSPAACWSTPRVGSGRASPASCTTWWPTTSP